jgi:flagellar hook-associated protein 3 FlgL
MPNRISFGQISTRILERLYANYSRLESVQQQLSTGKKLNRSSDNPVSTSQSMELRSEIDQFNSFQRNVNDGLAYLGTVDSTFGTANNLYQNMHERAIQAATDSNTAESRFFIGNEIRAIFDQMVALANTSFKDEYIFSGTNTQVPPYEIRGGGSQVMTAPGGLSGNMTMPALGVPIQIIDKNVDDSKDTITNDANAYHVIPGTFNAPGLTEGTDFTVDYVKGTVTFLTAAVTALALGPGFAMNYNWLRRNEKDLDGISNREVEEGVAARLNTTASEAFGSNLEQNAWEGIINLMEGTLKNKPDKILESIAKIDTSFKHQLSAQAANGARVQRFESTQVRNDERTIYTQELQSQTEDVDFAQAISDFNMQQTIYDASLQMGAKAMQNTLMNFL